jgi:hypothetical protein
MKLLTFLLILLPMGCARISSEPLVEKLPPSKAQGCTPDIYIEGTDLPGKILELCKIHSVDPDLPWSRSDTKVVVERAINLACQCGADGFVVNGYSGAEIKLMAFQYQEKIGKKKNITLATLYDIMHCRFKLGTWANSKCLVLPETPGRQRPNPRK